MINRLLSVSLFLLLILATVCSGQSPESLYGVSVPVQIAFEGKIEGRGSLVIDAYQTGSVHPTQSSAKIHIEKRPSQSEGIFADLGMVRIIPGAVYRIDMRVAELSQGRLEVIAPPGYEAELWVKSEANESPMEHKAYWLCPPSHGTAIYRAIDVVIRPTASKDVSPPGAPTSLTPGKIEWQVSLGENARGESAGLIGLYDAGTRDDWSELFTITPHKIVSEATIVDYVPRGRSSYEMRFYHPAQYDVEKAAFAGDPFVVYTISKGPKPSSIEITQDTRNIASLGQCNVPIATSKKSCLLRTGVWPRFVWTVEDWHDADTDPIIFHTLTEDVSGTDRVLTKETKERDGSLVWRSIDTYRSFPWGECLVKRAFSEDYYSEYQYYDDPADLQQYGRLKARLNSDGSWKTYGYKFKESGDERMNLASKRHAGMWTQINLPWGDSPPNPAFDKDVGDCTLYEYEKDSLGFYSRPGTQRSFINGICVGLEPVVYCEERSASASTMVRSVRYKPAASDQYGPAEFERDGKALATVTKYFPENSPDAYRKMRLYSLQYPEGRKISYAYQKGTWKGGIFTAEAGGRCHRQIQINGTNNAGTICSAFEGEPLDELKLVDGMSTMDVTIRDERSFVVRSEKHVWSGGVWTLINYSNRHYNVAGRLVKTEESNGAIVDYVYNGFDLMEEILDDGSSISRTYDVAGRLKNETRIAKGMPRLVTTFAYDAAGRILTKTQGGDQSELLVDSTTYDTAGNKLTESKPGQGKVSYSYDVRGRTITETMADGGTVIMKRNLDGKLACEQGTGTIAKYFFESVKESGKEIGFRVYRTVIGSADSRRWIQVTKDWLDREVRQERPTFGGSGLYTEENIYFLQSEKTPGCVAKTLKTGMPPTLCAYDEFGNLTRKAIDVDGNGLELASYDRVTESEKKYVHVADAWWLQESSWMYPRAYSDNRMRASLKLSRLTGHTASLRSEEISTDRDGNTTTTRTRVDRAANATRIEKTRNDSPSPVEVEIWVGGALRFTRDAQGREKEQRYDHLWRICQLVSPGEETAIISYELGSTLQRSVKSPGGREFYSATYDNMGRVIRESDASGRKTSSIYSLRGHLFRKWTSDGVLIQYGYNQYGECVSATRYPFPSWGDISQPVLDDAGLNNTKTFDEDSGLLAKETTQDGREIIYTYTTQGRRRTVTTRRSGRADIVATYEYFPLTGELKSITYNNGKPGVSYGEALGGAPSSYTRLGQVKIHTEGGYSIIYTYDEERPWIKVGEDRVPVESR